MTTTAKQVVRKLQAYYNPDKATQAARFFKTGPGEYGEGDQFLGLTMPQQRTVAKLYKELSLPEVKKLLDSKIHEHRMTGLLILTYKFPKADDEGKKTIYEFYVKNRAAVNNWDLVDGTTPNILGEYMFSHPKETKRLFKWARSQNLWERRIAMLACFPFIRAKQFDLPLQIAEILVHDKHDLIHKAVGWLLREIGKRDQTVEERFLDKYYKTMPRTMLRYAIERFDDEKRAWYMRT